MGFPCFVSFDLETTGLDPASDRIFQVGAVKVVDGQESDIFHTMVNPGRAIPLRIRRLTSDLSEDLHLAPSIEEVIPRFRAFVGDMPLVAHNADFDVSFLNAECARVGEKGLENPVWDTLELSRLVLPLAKRHSLGFLSSLFHLDKGRPHHALDDAMAACRLFLNLLDRIPSIGGDVCRTVIELMGESWPLSPLLEMGLDSATPKPPPLVRWPFLEINDSARRLDATFHKSLLEPGGAMERVQDGYEHRTCQVEMLEGVLTAFNDSRLAAIQAGTGTGKSLAYLIPAASWALENLQRVVISTHTIALQEQLMDKDIPSVERVLGANLRTCLLKGRQNYLCWRKWESLIREGLALSPGERRFAAHITPWLSKTATGDRSEISLGEIGNLWYLVAADEEGCPPRGCRHREACFVRGVRARARGAHIILVNHSLLLSDLKADNQVIPSYKHLIIDEAHHLEEEATRHLGIDLSITSINKSVMALAHGQDTAHRRGYRLLEDRVSRALGRKPWVTAVLDQGRRSLLEALECSTDLGPQVICFMEGEGVNPEEPYALLRLTERVLKRPSWPSLREAGERLAGSLGDVGSALGRLVDALDEPHDDLKADLAGWAMGFQRWSRELSFVVSCEESDWTYWFEANKGEALLKAAPIEVGDILAKRLFEPLSCCVMTSATLSVRSRFDYFLKGVGLLDKGVLTLELESPFDYETKAYLAVASDMPPPSDPRFEAECLEFLKELGETTRGRTLALFTSHRMLRSVAESIRRDLEAKGIAVLAQGVDGSRTGLLEEFRENPEAILMGASSFWEGIDMPGDGLSVVVVVRLPFQPPERPVPAARRERLKAKRRNAFRCLTLPDAALRLKQGFGRLIRRSTDRGAVIILDPRAGPGGSNYWGLLIGSLPKATFYSGPRSKILQGVEGFLAGDPVPVGEALECWYS